MVTRCDVMFFFLQLLSTIKIYLADKMMQSILIHVLFYVPSTEN